MRHVGLIAIVCLIAGVCLVASGSRAETFAGKDGAPICDDPKHILEFLDATRRGDEASLKRLSAHCVFVPEGTRMSIIEHVESLPADQGVKVRAFGPNGPTTGYSITKGFRNTQ